MALHYSCNFFLYCAFNKRFVRELKRLASSKRWTNLVTFRNESSNELDTRENSTKDNRNKDINVSILSSCLRPFKCQRISPTTTHVSCDENHHSSATSGYSSYCPKCTKSLEISE